MPSIQKIRDASFRNQGGRCYYCQMPMWRDDPTAFAETNALSPALARRFQATAEHLKPRSEGGGDTFENVVAACLYCNMHRHRSRTPLPSDKYLRKVRQRVASHRWHKVRLS